MEDLRKVVAPSPPSHPEVDSAVLNKTRFAIPTLEIFKAFHPDLHHISEGKWHNAKLALLQWPFTRAMVLAPQHLAMGIWGSKSEHDKLVQAAKGWKDRLTSRNDANIALEALFPKSDRSNAGIRGKSRSGRSTPSDVSFSSSYDDRFKAIEDRFDRLEGFLTNFLQSRDGSEDMAAADSCSTISEGDEPEEDRSPSWGSLPPQSGGRGLPSLLPAPTAPMFAFEPSTEQRSPPIPEASAEISEQAIHCLRLGTDAWDKVRYVQAQQALQAGGVFQPLRIDPRWGIAAPTGLVPDFLFKSEQTFGTFLHGLLKQREAFTAGITDIIKEHPAAADCIYRVFGPEDSAFRAVSNNLLQFTCGKRAEAVDARRKLVEASMPSAALQLQAIPPTPNFLFDSNQMMEVVKLQSQTTPLQPSFRRPGASRSSLRPGHRFSKSAGKRTSSKDASKASKANQQRTRSSHPDRATRRGDPPRRSGRNTNRKY